MEFAGKVALITGGGGGIGRAAALGFAARGAKVMVVDRDATLGGGTAELVRDQGGDGRFCKADVTVAADVRQYVQDTVESFGRIDCFFNNAGIEGVFAPTYEYPEDVFDAVMGVNLKGVFLGLRYVLPVMIAQKAGTVVNTSSTAGLIGAPGLSAYAAAKHAVLGLTKTAANETARFGVRVNAICPGAVDTRMMRAIEIQRNAEDPDSVSAAAKAGIPTGRYAKPDEIANLVLFLSSGMSEQITGAHFVIDGGRSAGGVAPASYPR